MRWLCSWLFENNQPNHTNKPMNWLVVLVMCLLPSSSAKQCVSMVFSQRLWRRNRWNILWIHAFQDVYNVMLRMQTHREQRLSHLTNNGFMNKYTNVKSDSNDLRQRRDINQNEYWTIKCIRVNSSTLKDSKWEFHFVGSWWYFKQKYSSVQ